MIEIVNRGLSTTAAVYEYRVPLTPQDGFAALKYRRIALPFQVSVSVIARLSITILLLRLFGVHRWFKLAVVAQFCIVAMLSVAFIPMAFSEVKPIQALWDPSLTVRERWDPNIWVAYAAATQCEKEPTTPLEGCWDDGFPADENPQPSTLSQIWSLSCFPS